MVYLSQSVQICLLKKFDYQMYLLLSLAEFKVTKNAASLRKKELSEISISIVELNDAFAIVIKPG